MTYSNSSAMKVNIVDYLALPVFVIAAAVSVGLLGSTIAGFDVGQTMIDLGSGHGFSAANIAAIATLVYVAWTNDWSANVVLSGVQLWVVIATIGLLIAPPFFPVLQDTLAQDPAALAALLIQIGGFITFSYLG